MVYGKQSSPDGTVQIGYPIKNTKLSYVREETRRGAWWAESDMEYISMKIKEGNTVSDRAQKANVDEIDIRSIVTDGNLFDLPFPLGEIIYEKYTPNSNGSIDENLRAINSIPEYISFINEVQQKVFNGTRKQDGPGEIYTRDYVIKNKSDPEGSYLRKYRFYGQSMFHEDNGWDNTVGGATKVEKDNYETRPFD